MEAIDRTAPLARSDGLVVQELSDEVLVYDLERHRAHSLNRTAALIWRHCDGKTCVADMTALLQRDLNLPPEEEVVWLALERLGRAHLLRERLTPPVTATRTSRRALVQKLAMAGGLALVTSVVAPEAHAAGTPCMITKKNQSTCMGGCCCTSTGAIGSLGTCVLKAKDCSFGTAFCV